MLIPVQPKNPRRRRQRGLLQGPPPPLAGPVLVAATYEATAAVTLFFDRAIDITGLNLSEILVADGPNGFLYEGSGTPVQGTPSSVQIDLTGIDEISGPDVTLTASVANGIVAVDGGVAWDGVTDVSLPFP